MASRRFDIVFDGSLIDGFERTQVEENLRALFQLGDQAVARLFSGEPIAIKRDLERAEASKYQAALTKAGARIKLSLAGTAPAGMQAGTPTPTEPATAAATKDAAPAATESGEYGLSLLPPGTPVLKPGELQQQPAVEINCDHIEMKKVNLFLDGSAEPASATVSEVPPAIDTDAFTLAEADGELLQQHEKAPHQTRDIDTSRLMLMDED